MQTNKMTALITGASRGIGLATAECFAAAGYDLILTCKSSMDTLQKAAVRLQEQNHISCLPLQADMGREEDVLRLFSSIDSLDVLVNNAGIAHIGLLTDLTSDEWHRIMAVNLDSCFYTCRAAIPLMLKNHCGKIINISSVCGIQVTAIASGVIDTSMTSCPTPEDKAALTAEIPADRLGLPEEAARLILQTAQAPAYMTGQIITIDGGWY